MNSRARTAAKIVLLVVVVAIVVHFAVTGLPGLEYFNPHGH